MYPRDDQHDAFGALQDGGGPGPLPVRHLGSLFLGPLVQLRRTLNGPSDHGPNFARENFKSGLSKVGRKSVNDDLNVLA